MWNELRRLCQSCTRQVFAKRLNPWGLPRPGSGHGAMRMGQSQKVAIKTVSSRRDRLITANSTASSPRHAEVGLRFQPLSATTIGTTGRLAYSPKDAAAALGCGLTHLYGLIASGQIKARKSGRKTLIPAASLHAFLHALPPAEIYTGCKA